ncbi:hypothetical protein LCGC14_2970820 [marine sediment metagenome]|uniref:Uncharacterized protein n=1 Tax=marine sediment metagenome TaxID=412755 RepID=A0A0F8XAC3_9ZZZZ
MKSIENSGMLTLANLSIINKNKMLEKYLSVQDTIALFAAIGIIVVVIIKLIQFRNKW